MKKKENSWGNKNMKTEAVYLSIYKYIYIYIYAYIYIKVCM